MQDRGEKDVALGMLVLKNSLGEDGGMEIGWIFVGSPVQLNPIGVRLGVGPCDSQFCIVGLAPSRISSLVDGHYRCTGPLHHGDKVGFFAEYNEYKSWFFSARHGSVLYCR